MVAAATALLDRGWGRPVQSHELHHHLEPQHMTDAELIALAATAAVSTGDEDDPERPSPVALTGSIERWRKSCRSIRLTAARELLRRRAVRRDLAQWCTTVLEPGGLAPAQHHLLLLDRLEAIERGDIDRLMVLMPPGSAKSTYVSTLFPPWYLARHPDHAIVAASHTAELAERFGRRVRNIINEHSATLGVELAADIQAAGQWETTQGGEYFAVGVLGAVTGRRADVVVIDDPVRSRLEADSETVRERVWEWWKADLLTRLKPGAKIVLVMTRWHEDDLGGRLLAEMEAGGRKWEVLRLPMEAEADDPLGRAPGAPLWPEWFTDDMRADAKRDPRTWSALYQQRPAPDTGTYFERDWLRPANAIPRREDMRIYGGIGLRRDRE